MPGGSSRCSHNGTEDPSVLAALTATATRSPSVRASDVNSLPLDNMFKVVTVVPQIMMEFNSAVSQETKIMVISKNCLKSNEAKWPLDFIGPSKS
jgi:hypothetical protein